MAVLAEYEPLLASIIQDSLLAGWLTGGYEIGKGLKVSGGMFGNPPPISVAITGEPPPLITFPIIDKALESLQARKIVLKSEWQTANQAARQRAFTVATLATEASVAKVRDAVIEAIATGGTLREFKEVVGDAIGKSAMGPAQLESVFRTNIAQAYSDGFEAVAQHPMVRDAFPYRETIPIHDSRLTELCQVVAKSGLDGGAIFRADDPVWIAYKPPRHYQCRCGQSALTIEQAAAKGVREAIRWLATGIAPLHPEFVPWPSVELPEGWR